ncbi:MAG: hypothetical protein OEZ22_02955 [Spirochaetia bacterium]|nr:hypothetical protein [Spirochaetia bacterium]
MRTNFSDAQETKERKYRAFLALPPPEGLLEMFKKFQKGKEKPPLRWSAPEKIHLTLFFWPSLNRNEFNNLWEYLMPKLKDNNLLKKYKSDIRGFHFFPKAQVIFLREISEEIFNLYENIKGNIKDIPKEFDFNKSESFTPHWTLARKFRYSHLIKYKKYFQSLDTFSFSEKTPSPVLYLSVDSIYESKPFIKG